MNQHFHILAIHPSTKGFGYALLEDRERLVDWGVKSVGKEKNAECLVKLKEMIGFFQPSVIVLEDYGESRRAVRIRNLGQEIIALAKTHKVKAVLFPRAQVQQVFFGDGKGTKHMMAEIMAQKFPEELGERLPSKRKSWESEDYRMGIFGALALALTLVTQGQSIEVSGFNPN